MHLHTSHFYCFFAFLLLLGCGNNTNNPIAQNNSSPQSDSVQNLGSSSTTNQDTQILNAQNSGSVPTPNPLPTSSTDGKTIEINAGGETRSFELPDGTKIILNRNSRASYTEDKNTQERNVKLNGEAYFEVKNSKVKKFNVYAGNTKTTVVGTIFNLRAYDNENEVTIDVMEGEVLFAELDNDTRKAAVKNKERAVYQKPKRNIQKEIPANEDFKWWIPKGNTPNNTNNNTVNNNIIANDTRTWKTDTYKCNTKLEQNTIQGKKETKTLPLRIATGYSIEFTALGGSLGATITSTDAHSLDKGDKIAFVAENKTQRSFAFVYEMRTVNSGGQKRFINAIQLDMKALNWLANNTFQQIQIVKTADNKTYSRRIDAEMQTSFAETVRCFLETAEKE